MTAGACLAPGLLPFQRQRVADVIRRIGGCPLGQLAPVFMDSDVSAVRALDPVAKDLHAEACTVRAPLLAAEHAIDILSAAWVLGFSLGLRLGQKFGRRKEGPRFLERENDERLPRRRIEKLIGIVQHALGPDIEELAARRWATDMGRAGRVYRP